MAVSINVVEAADRLREPDYRGWLASHQPAGWLARRAKRRRNGRKEVDLDVGALSAHVPEQLAQAFQDPHAPGRAWWDRRLRPPSWVWFGGGHQSLFAISASLAGQRRKRTLALTPPKPKPFDRA